MLSAEHLRVAVEQHFREHAPRFELAADGVRASYVLNWGGFVNYSYRIGDGRRRYHLKLARDAEHQAPLARWYDLRQRLTAYHAPTVVEWVDLGEVAGLLFQVVPGAVPSCSAEVVDAVMPVLAALFSDEALARALADASPGSVARTARDAYLASLDDRFVEDLRGISASPPPFVSASLVRWMHDEADRLRDLIAAAPAFDETLTSPVHGDLWLNNIHWVSPGEWYLLDWDDLGIGDPAADVAALVGPTASDLRPLKLAERARLVLTPLQRERLTLLGRATLLDWIIDPLADWVEAGVAEEHLTEVRAEKERVHRAALTTYRAMYG